MVRGSVRAALGRKASQMSKTPIGVYKDLLLASWSTYGIFAILRSAYAASSSKIEVGAKDDTLRFWKSKEALRQAEMLLASQTSALQAVQTRAGNLLGWTVTAIIAVSTVFVSSSLKEWILAAVVVIIPLLFTALICVGSLRPRHWTFPGFKPIQILNSTFSTELEQSESLAKGCNDSIIQNERELQRIGRRMLVAWRLFVVSPFAGLAIISPRVLSWNQFLLWHDLIGCLGLP
jgi:hypothetical protein